MAQNTTREQKLQHVKQTLALAEKYDHAVNVLSYDQETICPIDAMEEQGEVWAFLNNQSYKLTKDIPLLLRRRSTCMSTEASWRNWTA